MIEGGLPGPGLVTLVLISKYRDHLPLERQAKIYQRFGVDLSPKTIVGWVEAGAWRPKSSRIYGGVFRVLIVDNMRAIVAVADPLEARIVPAFRESSTWVKCSRGIRPVVL